jgi:hypothetical protein
MYYLTEIPQPDILSATSSQELLWDLEKQPTNGDHIAVPSPRCNPISHETASPKLIIDTTHVGLHGYDGFSHG